MTQLCFVVPCMGRLEHLQQNIAQLVLQPDSQVVVVDYSCPQQSGSWVEANYPQVQVVRIPGETRYNQSRARNAGGHAANTPWICFCDADILVDGAFVQKVRPLLKPGYFFRPDPVDDQGIWGTFICSRDDFQKTGGYDEVYQGWGDADNDLFASLKFVGAKIAVFPSNLLLHLPHGDEARVKFYDLKDRWFNCTINRLYRYAKFDIMQLNRAFISRENREQLYKKIAASARDAILHNKPLDLKIEIAVGSDMPSNWKLDRSLNYRYRPT